MTGLDSPLFLTSAKDGSGILYVVQRGGRILAADGSGNRRGTFLDIAGRVQSGGEEGLLGLAFHPGFRSNRRFFVYYTDNGSDVVVSEFRATSTTRADAGSERVLLRINHPYSNHNGGMIAFGHDGFLYIGTGDGGSGGDPHNNGQRRDTLLGKILRIDVNRGSPYAIPSSNPYAGSSTFRREIWDYGVRNPWRFSFDRSTGAMFMGDVGQGEWEEINVERRGDGGNNYGWRVMEGKHCYQSSSCNTSGKVRPIAEYSHALGCSVTGGYVYRGSRYASLRGAYFYGDYCSGRIWALDAAAALRGISRVRQVLDTSLSISSFGENEAGDIFICDLGGRIYRLRAA